MLRVIQSLVDLGLVSGMLFCGALFGAALFHGAPAGADWLKTRDGALIETEGAWEVRGAMVVFKVPGGTLSSMRLSEVDLEASREATAAALAPPPPPPAEEEEPAREAVLVVTNDDIPRALPPVVSAAGAEEGAATGETSAGGEGSAAAPRREPVEVVAWRQVDGAGVDGVEIHGTVRNQGRDIVMNVRVRVSLLGEEGEELGATNAFLGAPSLAPTSTTTFRALFPNVYRFETPRFEVRSQAIQVRPSEEEEAGDEQG